MTSERIQRRIEQFLDEADDALSKLDWDTVRSRAEAVLRIDPQNSEALTLLAASQRDAGPPVAASVSDVGAGAPASPPQPTSFVSGRYVVTKFLGEGGKKKVFLARDSRLDRDVAFALIKTEGLDEASRVRVQREAEAMGRLGAHPHIVTVFDIGEEAGQPYLVLPVLAGGDVEGVIEKAPDNKLPIERAVKIAVDTCLGLEFAHAKGIVHRDLKPGNVWLTEDGRAMIGDFGLAVAVDKSRLTQAGMMVGTVNYMPPEQAMGGEVGPRSDLYSLGAMLYEMVCGRPPFVGDDSVAIIGQHLNTPPVAPSWHRPDCPAALETLILRLLEKDPEKRPRSAEEVRKALEGVGTAVRPRDASVAVDVPTSGDNPLYRRTFVGRENEVRQLQQAFDAALSGQGGLVMVVGEPGIGKTALCEQLATYVALRGGKALVGHCYEEGSLSLPYLAFVEAMRTYVLAREPDGLRSDLGTGAADVARIVSEVRDRVQGVELRPAGDPEDDRWRLLQAVTSFLRNASTVQPLCLVLEDLHWADRGTLDLLIHASRNLQGTRLLMVGTYRDVEVDRTHPLSNTLAELRRSANFQRAPLRGLTVDEVHRMYEAIRGNDVPWGQAETVYRATEGNPLFVQEVLRFLVEEGLVVREDGRYVAQQGAGAGIPEGLRDVVGKRLNRLGEHANQALTVAAVVGRDFRLDVLQTVLGLPEEQLFAALEEAQERAIIEPRDYLGALGFRFTHAFFRQTLYEEIFAPRRIRLHQQVAAALETIYGRRLDDHASELAEHYAQSVDPSDLAKAVMYSRKAAERARAVFDYGEALRRLEQALKAQEVLDPDHHATLCDLWLGMGEALLLLNERDRAADEAAAAALRRAQAMEDDDRAFAACRIALDSIIGPVNQRTTYWLEQAERHVGTSVANRIRLLRSKAGYLVQLGFVAEAAVALREPLHLARESGDQNEEAGVTWLMLIQSVATREEEEELLERAGQLLETLNISNLNRFALISNVIVCKFGWGDRDAAEKLAERLRIDANEIRFVRVQALADYWRAVFRAMDGRLDDISISPVMERQQAQIFANRIDRWLGQPYRVLGLQPAAGTHSFALSMINIWRLRDTHEDDAAAAAFTEYLSTLSTQFERLGPGQLANLLEVAVELGDAKAARSLYESLVDRPYYRPLYIPSINTISLDLVLGRAASMLGMQVEARQHLQVAVEMCRKFPVRPELALASLELAELLLEHYSHEHDAAIEHLDFAIAELRDMKMQPALERALRHRGLLKA